MNFLKVFFKTSVGTSLVVLGILGTILYLGLYSILVYFLIWIYFSFYKGKIKKYFQQQKELYFFKIKKKFFQAETPEQLFTCMEDFYKEHNLQGKLSEGDMLHYIEIEQVYSKKLSTFQSEGKITIEDKVREILLNFSLSQYQGILYKNFSYSNNKIIENIFIIPFSGLLWGFGLLLVIWFFVMLPQGKGAETLEIFGCFAGLMVIVFAINRIFASFRIKIISKLLFLDFSFSEFQKHTTSYFNSQKFLQEKTAQNLILFSKIVHYLMKNISERKNNIQILNITRFLLFFNSGEVKKYFFVSKKKLAEDAFWVKNIIQRWAKMQLEDQKHIEEVQKTMHSEYVELYLRRRELYEKSLNSLL